MTKTFLTTLATVFALSAMTTTVNAQSSSRMDFAKATTAFVKHNAEESVVATGETPASLVSDKAIRSFNKTFKGVTPRWYADKNQFLARFSESGTVTHALYEKGGRMVYSVTKGSGSLLPAEVADMLQEVYPCYTIATATKAVSDGTTAWIADLRQHNSLLVVKVIDGDIVETTRYRTNEK